MNFERPRIDLLNNCQLHSHEVIFPVDNSFLLYYLPPWSSNATRVLIPASFDCHIQNKEIGTTECFTIELIRIIRTSTY